MAAKSPNLYRAVAENVGNGVEVGVGVVGPVAVVVVAVMDVVRCCDGKSSELSRVFRFFFLEVDTEAVDLLFVVSDVRVVVPVLVAIVVADGAAGRARILPLEPTKC